MPASRTTRSAGVLATALAGMIGFLGCAGNSPSGRIYVGRGGVVDSGIIDVTCPKPVSEYTKDFEAEVSKISRDITAAAKDTTKSNLDSISARLATTTRQLASRSTTATDADVLLWRLCVDGLNRNISPTAGDRLRQTVIDAWAEVQPLPPNQQQQSIRLIRSELAANLAAGRALHENTSTLAGLFSGLADSILRNPHLRIMALLFPRSNLDLTIDDFAAGSLADTAMDSLASSGLLSDTLERVKFTSAAAVIRSRIDGMMPTISRLADSTGQRYRILDDVWRSQLPIIRKLEGIPIDSIGETYTALRGMRDAYSAVSSSTLAYLANVRSFLSPEDHTITRETLRRTLVSERFAMSLLLPGLKRLAAGVEFLARADTALSSSTNPPSARER